MERTGGLEPHVFALATQGSAFELCPRIVGASETNWTRSFTVLFTADKRVSFCKRAPPEVRVAKGPEADRSSALKPYQKLQSYWRGTKAKVGIVELNHESVASLEQRYSIQLPDDFRDYLLHSCPKDDFGYDKETTWWPRDRLKNIPDEYEHKVTDATIAKNAAKYVF